jgi:RNA polymerase sigma factor (sigma-70 family)
MSTLRALKVHLARPAPRAPHPQEAELYDLCRQLQAGRLTEERLVQTPVFEECVRDYGDYFWKNYRNLVQRYAPCLDEEDLQNVARMALLVALREFDPAIRLQAGRTFIDFCTYRMLRELRREVRANYTGGRENRLTSRPLVVEHLSWLGDWDSVLLRNCLNKRPLTETQEVFLGATASLDFLAVRCALEKLPWPYAEIVRLKDLQEFSYQQVADQLWPDQGQNRGTVKRLHAFALDLLRELLHAAQPEADPDAVPAAVLA